MKIIQITNNSEREDLSEISRLHLKRQGNDVDGTLIKQKNETIIEKIQDNEDLFFLLKEGSQGVGYMCLSNGEKNITPSDHQIWSLYILPRHRGKGYATNILLKITQTIKNNVCIEIGSKDDYIRNGIEIDRERLLQLLKRTKYIINFKGKRKITLKKIYQVN